MIYCHLYFIQLITSRLLLVLGHIWYKPRCLKERHRKFYDFITHTPQHTNKALQIIFTVNTAVYPHAPFVRLIYMLTKCLDIYSSMTFGYFFTKLSVSVWECVCVRVCVCVCVCVPVCVCVCLPNDPATVSAAALWGAWWTERAVGTGQHELSIACCYGDHDDVTVSSTTTKNKYMIMSC